MKNLPLSLLAQWCGCEIAPASENLEITGIQHDSRDVKVGELFVALPGDRVDGHDFVASAKASGAVAALVAHPVPVDIPQLVVADPLLSYGEIAKQYRLLTGVKVVAITGSVGKTTTKEMIACVLENGFSVAKTQGNHNNNLGLPMTIMEMPDETELAVLELGMNHFGEMSYLTSIAQPDVVVITNIGTMHIEHLGTRQGILKAKLEIMQGIRENGISVFNGDEPLLWNLRDEIQRRIYFGIENDQCDLVASDIQQEGDGISFQVKGLDREFRVYVPQEGRHTVYNALAAIAVALLQDINPESIQYQLGTFRNTGMRQRVFEKNGITIIEDCYNAGPESMEAALRVLDEHSAQGRHIAVLGDMLELGSRAMAEHYRVGRLVACTTDLLFAYGKHSERTIVGAITGGMNDKCARHYDSQEEMAQALHTLTKPGDVLLFKGSRGMRMEKVLQLFLKSLEN